MLVLLRIGFIVGPLAALVAAGVSAASGSPRSLWTRAAKVAVLSVGVWMVYVGLSPHETPCAGPAARCPTVYGFRAPLPDGHAAGAVFLLAGFVFPAVWIGWRRLMPAATAGAALALGPTVLAFWTAPRGDNDGLWSLIFWFLPALGGFAALAASLATTRSSVSPLRR